METQAQSAVPATAENLQKLFSGSADFCSREIPISGGRKVTLCYIDGLVAANSVAEYVLRPMLTCPELLQTESADALRESLASCGTFCAGAAVRSELTETAQALLGGWCALFCGGTGAVVFDVPTFDKRAVGAPQEEKVVKGARDAFVETLRVNTMLVRKKLRDPALKVEELILGSCSNTRVAVVYLDGYTKAGLVTEVRRRLEKIRAVGVISTAVLEEQICDKPSSPFPQLIHTERPDKFCVNLLEGRVGILVDGMPLGFLAPGTFAQHLKVPEDLSGHWLMASVLTILRYFSLLVSLLLPGFYVAAVVYHHELLPTKLLQAIIDARQSVPFPTAVEVIAMLIAFELLQEAGLRLPSPSGQTVSIVGALVVGQSAVEAKAVSPMVVIVVAMAGMAGYTMPSPDMASALRIWRFLLVISAVAAGFYGLVTAGILLTWHLCTLENFGVPYMTPFTGGGGLLRGLTRAPASKYTPGEPALQPKEARK